MNDEELIEVEENKIIFSFPKWYWDLVSDGEGHSTQVEWTGTYWRIYVDGIAIGDTAIGSYQSSTPRVNTDG